MITFDDIKEALKNANDNKIKEEYTTRQQRNIETNNMIAKEVLFEFPYEMLSLPNFPTDIMKVNYLISKLLNNNDPQTLKIVKKVLKKYNYKIESELLQTIQRTDLFFNNEIDFITFSNLIYGTISITNINGVKNNKVSLKSRMGDIILYPLDYYFKTNKIPAKLRRSYCHNLTSDILNTNNDLYGAYYYIPLEFAAFIEHSVLLDLKHNLVLDFANNIVLSLDIWQKFYKKPAILINGKDFSNLSQKCHEELDLYLTTCTLDTVRRTRKKNKNTQF